MEGRFSNSGRREICERIRFEAKTDPHTFVLCGAYVNLTREFSAYTSLAEEFLSQLMPIFESLRQREDLPCCYPIAMGTPRQQITYSVNSSIRFYQLNVMYCVFCSSFFFLTVFDRNVIGLFVAHTGVAYCSFSK